MNRREFLIATGSTAIAMGALQSLLLAEPSGDVAATTPEIAALYRESMVIDALSSPFPDFPLSNPTVAAGDVQHGCALLWKLTVLARHPAR